jgi:hypothetical protein
MVVRNAQMPGHPGISPGTRFCAVQDHANRREAPVHGLTNKADIMAARCEMLSQCCELAKTTPVNKGHMHEISLFRDSKH